MEAKKESTSDLKNNHKRRIKKMLTLISSILGVIILLLFVIVFINFRQDLTAARNKLSEIHTEIFKSKYGDVEYRITGNGPTILVVHGVSGGIDQGMYIAESFVPPDKNYRFLYVSRFGYVKSSLPENASARLQAAAYKELLDYLGIDRVFVFGNSAGGTSSMWFAIDYPEKTQGLILLSSAVPYSKPISSPPELVYQNNFIFWAAGKIFPDKLIGLLLPENLISSLTPEEKASIIKDVFVGSLPITERTHGAIFDDNVSTPSINSLPFEQIKVPTLILQSVDDPREKEGGITLSKRIPDNRYVGLTGGHFLLRQEEKVRGEIDSFILKQP